ncbi:hypothetical protein EG68_03481 [Paragonimus skrjabini miyazakii]|uniref:Ig-like domain-containing protein n=1 Tax=Paragonimus skrjabini miyazakii TaxID=59628 RepID=A0A8S9Z4Z2_9TREM|nr:hypothetical protein EG68_03481 [Paragonimus skrjabini miyazakii]
MLIVLVLMFETVTFFKPSVLIDTSDSSNLKRRPPATIHLKKHARKLTQQVTGTWISAPSKDSFLKPPVIVEHSPKLVITQVGGNVTLFCRWSANPRANISWHRGKLSTTDVIMTNKKMNTSSVSTNLSRWIQKKGPVPRSSRLFLTNFQISDADIYSCRVTNNFGTATQTLTVVRKGDILFTRIPKNQTVLENHSSLLFDCQAVSDESIISYTWLKDGRDLRFYPDLQRRFTIFSNGSLHLLNVRYQDHGVYTCQPETLSSYSQVLSYGTQTKDNPDNQFPYNLPGRMRHASAHLFVHFIPRISTAGPRVIYLGLSGPGRLPCTLEASPSVHTIEWRRMFADQQTRLFYPANGSDRKHTVIWWKQFVTEELNSKRRPNEIKVTYWHEWTSVTSKDVGQYQCRGQNRIGWSEWSSPLEIITKGERCSLCNSPFITRCNPNSYFHLTTDRH